MVTSIVIAEDQLVYRDSLKQILKSMPSLELVGTANNGLEALDAVNRYRPDVLLLDIEMPVMDGGKVLKQLKQENAKVKVVILTVFGHNWTVEHSVALGADGFLEKGDEYEELEKCIETVMNDNIYLGSKFIKPLLQSKFVSTDKARTKPLQPEDVQLMEKTAERKNTKAIASELHKSERTVERMRTRMINKHSAPDFFALVIRGIMAGLFFPKDTLKK
ncbi:MAG: response regulator transcription factor [Bacteroidetes bacterium]|nr:response regulator transcription factor [Bacteroidota bacterium]